ncbi:hypothetical protein [Streptomyces sp. NBC_01216]|uniref:hypothetical protein n=1 Tax=unclassified Streptomyces TaxID=2593676 RepID=UPI002E15C7FF|nr:hypothetical protein OG393_08345 [Streptomyces sp. NBC_01216]
MTRPLPVSPSPDGDVADHSHDPNEVTVQLDAVRIGGGDGDWSLRPAEAVPELRREPNGPVFVDESGRRSRRFRRFGTLVGVACAVYAVVIVATVLTGNSSAPWVPVPNQEQAVPAGQDEASASPTESTTPSPSLSATLTPSATDAGRRTTAPTRTASPSATTRVPSTPSASASATAPAPDATTQSPAPSGPATPTPTSPVPSGTVTPETTTSPANGDSMAIGLGHPIPTEHGQAVAPSPENIL